MGKQHTFDGKTDRELLEEINNGLYAICLEHGGDIQEEYKKIIYIYFDKYEALSEHYCEKCGNSAQLVSDGYWLETICEKCWNERMSWQIQKGYRYNKVICEKNS